MTTEELQAEAAAAKATAEGKGKLKLPSVKEVVGELLSIENIESNGTEIVLLSIQDTEDEIIKTSTSPAYWKKVGRSFVEGSVVKFSYEARLAGVTGYLNASKEMVAHTANGNNLTNASKFSPIAYQRMLDNKAKEGDIATLEAVEVERVSAIANYLGAYVSKR